MSIKSKEVKIPAADGGAFMAYMAMPEDAEKNAHPGILLIQEIFGVNSDMREKCDDFARQGYVAICPDLFWRIEPGIQLVDSEEPQLKRAFELYELFDEEKGLTDLQTTLGYMRHEKECDGKVGTVGYCLGGKLAFMMACHTDVNAAVSYYGVAIDTLIDQAKNINNPTMLHVAGEDEFVDKDAQNKMRKGLSNNDYVTMHTYDGVGHAFARLHGMHYDEDSATKANNRTDTFFETHLK
jgi:carboxymethylenebutenolidase